MCTCCHAGIQHLKTGKSSPVTFPAMSGPRNRIRLPVTLSPGGCECVRGDGKGRVEVSRWLIFITDGGV